MKVTRSSQSLNLDGNAYNTRHSNQYNKVQVEHLVYTVTVHTHLADRRQFEGLSQVMAVGSNTQVHLVAVGGALECLGDSQDGITRKHLHATPPGSGRRISRGGELQK